MEADQSERQRGPGLLVALAVAATLAAAAGTGVRATRGAQTTADEPQYLLSAISIAEDGDLDIADELAARRWRDFHEAPLPEQTRPIPGRDGARRVSPHDPLLPLLLAGPVAAAGWVGAKLALSVVAGGLAALIAWTATARFHAPPRAAAAVVAVFALSAPLAPYGTQVYPELPAALAVTLAVVALTGSFPRRHRWLLAAVVVVLPWLAVKYAPVAAVLAALAVLRLWRGGERGPALGLVMSCVAAGVVFVAVHLAVWTGVTPYASGDHFTGGELTVIGVAPDYLGRSQRLLGLLVDRHFGLAAWQPAWLLAVPALAALARRRPPGWEVLAVPLAVGWLNATFVALTMHGFWFPGRQVVVVLPCAVLAVAVAASRSRGALTATVGMGVLGVATYGWILADGVRGRLNWVVDLWRVSDPWYRAWSALLPSYLRVDAHTWLRHGAWLAVVVAAAVVAWRRAGATPVTACGDGAAPTTPGLPGPPGYPGDR